MRCTFGRAATAARSRSVSACVGPISSSVQSGRRSATSSSKAKSTFADRKFPANPITGRSSPASSGGAIDGSAAAAKCPKSPTFRHEMRAAVVPAVALRQRRRGGEDQAGAFGGDRVALGHECTLLRVTVIGLLRVVVDAVVDREALADAADGRGEAGVVDPQDHRFVPTAEMAPDRPCGQSRVDPGGQPEAVPPGQDVRSLHRSHAGPDLLGAEQLPSLRPAVGPAKHPA